MVGGVGSSYSINIPTPILTQNTVFWISSKIPSCDESSRVPVLVTFDPITNFIPPLPTITGINSISGGAQITLSNAQRFKYYDVSIGGIALTTFNGSSVTICSQKQNNVFWFISYNDYCESERVEMNFNNLLVQPPTIVGKNTVCGNTIFNLTATGGYTYSWLIPYRDKLCFTTSGICLEVGEVKYDTIINTNTYVLSIPGGTSKDIGVINTNIEGCRSVTNFLSILPNYIPETSSFGYWDNGRSGIGHSGDYYISYREKDSLFFEADVINATIIGQRFVKGQYTQKQYTIYDEGKALVTITAFAISPAGCTSPVKRYYQYGKTTPNDPITITGLSNEIAAK